MTISHDWELPHQLQAAEFCEVAVIVAKMQANHEDTRLIPRYGTFCSSFWLKKNQPNKKQQKSEYYLQSTFKVSWSSQNIGSALLALLPTIFFQPISRAFYGGRFTRMSCTLIARGIKAQCKGANRMLWKWATAVLWKVPSPQSHRSEALFRGEQEGKTDLCFKLLQNYVLPCLSPWYWWQCQATRRSQTIHVWQLHLLIIWVSHLSLNW